MLPKRLIFLFVLLLFLSSGSSADPQPLSVSAGPDWFGYDGSWSAVNIRVGRPSQWLQVFPNTVNSETWVVAQAGCDDTLTCRTERGGLFYPDKSSTWNEVGTYDLGDNIELGEEGVGVYGFDTIALDDGISVPGQIIGVVNYIDIWLGSLGLGITAANFEGGNKPAFLSSLVQNASLIPSHSYGYTAGAIYQQKGVQASLTLGGVDKNRFTENDVSFSLPTDDKPVVAINSITATANPNGSGPPWTDLSTSLKPDNNGLFTIDSSTPFLWFPETVCDTFAQALGLTYNDTLQLYTYTNSTNLETLRSWGLTFTFAIADLPGSSKLVNINLPFAAFDLSLTYPFPNVTRGTNVSYFPLRKTSSTDYTIGRAFLQEAYLAVDYERRNFSISQAEFGPDSAAATDLIPITRPPDSKLPGPIVDSSSLSSGAKAGIGVGVALLVIILIAAAIFFWRRKRKSQYPELSNHNDSQRAQLEKNIFWRLFNKSVVHDDEAIELSGDKHHPVEAPADPEVTYFELPGETPKELPDSSAGSGGPFKVRLGGGDQPTAPAAVAAARNSQSGPSELAVPEPDPQKTLESDLPSYSQIQRGESISEPPTVSPESTLQTGQRSASEGGMPSPITGTASSTHSPPSSTNPSYSHHQPLSHINRVSAGSRMGSRSSRFVEEGLRDSADTRASHGHGSSSPQVARRFSWEE